MKFLCNILVFTFLAFPFGNIFAQTSQPVPSNVEFLNYFSQAGIFVLKSQYSNALQCYQKCIELNPKSSASYFQMAKIHFSSGDAHAAEMFAKKAHDLNPDNVFYISLLSDICIKNGDFDNAIKYAKKVLEKYPSYENYHQLTDLYVSLNRYQDAVDLLSSFEKVYGFDSEICTRKSDLYRLLGRFQDSENEILRLVNSDPSNLYYFFLLSDLYFQTNQISKVQPVINRMEAVNSENGMVYLVKTFLCNAQANDVCFYQNLIKSLKSEDVTLEQKLFLVSQFSRQHDGFEVQKVDTIFEVLSTSYPDSAVVHIAYSDFLFNTYRYNKSADELQKALDIDKSNFDIWRGLFRTYAIFDNKRLTQVVNKALEYYPEQLDVFVYSAAGDILEQNYDEAADFLQQSLDFGIKETASAYLYFFFNAVYNFKTGDVNAALDNFRKYFAANHSDYYYLAKYAAYLVECGKDKDVAEIIIKMCIAADKDSPYFNYVYSFYLLKNNDLKGAEYFVEKALANNLSKLPFIYELAADIYAKHQNCEKALANYHLAIDNGGNAQIINNKIKKCN